MAKALGLSLGFHSLLFRAGRHKRTHERGIATFVKRSSRSIGVRCLPTRLKVRQLRGASAKIHECFFLAELSKLPSYPRKESDPSDETSDEKNSL